MTNIADPDQLASDLHFLQRQGISGFSRTRVKVNIQKILFLHQTYVVRAHWNCPTDVIPVSTQNMLWCIKKKKKKKNYAKLSARFPYLSEQ